MAKRIKKRHACDRDNLWRSMRVLRRFDRATLVATAESSDRNAQTYLWRLMRAGYVRIAKAGFGGSQPQATLYALVRDTGPLSPQPKKTRGAGVRDRNTEELFAESEVGHE